MYKIKQDASLSDLQKLYLKKKPVVYMLWRKTYKHNMHKISQ